MTQPRSEPFGKPNGEFAGTLIEFSDPELDRRYSHGVYLNLRGYPDYTPYAHAVVEFAEPPAGLGIDELRVTDVLAANEIMRRSGDTLWTEQDAPGATPQGWLWHHVAGSRCLMLIPADLKNAFRHHAGLTTVNADRNRRGLWHQQQPPAVQFERSGAAPEELITQVEQEFFGFTLPGAYRSFLAATNGGKPKSPAVHTALGFVADQRLFGLQREDANEDLVFGNERLGDRFTADFLAVGNVQGGMLVLKVAGQDAGSVWFWDNDDPRDHDSQTPATICRDLLYRCGEDFNDFARNLSAVPEEIADIARGAVDNGFVRVVTDTSRHGSALYAAADSGHDDDQQGGPPGPAPTGQHAEQPRWGEHPHAAQQASHPQHGGGFPPPQGMPPAPAGFGSAEYQR